MKLFQIPICMALALLVAQSATADIVTAEYTFDGNSAAPTSPGDSNTAISDYDADPGANSGISSSRAFINTNFADGASSFAVHEFTLTPIGPLSAMHFNRAVNSALSFSYRITGNLPPGQSYSVDVSTSVDAHGSSTTVVGNASGLIVLGNVDLTSLGTQTGPVTFRFTFDDTSSSTGTQHTLDNISVDFESVPEPASAVLCGFMAIAGLGFRRRD